MATEVKVRTSLDASAIGSGLTKVRGQFAEFQRDIGSKLGGFFALAGIEEGLRRLIEKGSRITDLADRFGVSTEALQRFGNVAEEDGASLESVARAMNKLTVSREDALRGNKEAIESFSQLGISLQEIQRLSVEDLFYRVADATVTAKDSGTAYADVVKLMGRSAGELIPTFQRGTKAIREQGEAIGVLADEEVRSLDKIGDELTGFKNRLFVFGGAFLTFFAKIAGALGEVFGTAINTAERSISTLGDALSLALHGHFIEAGKALASGVKENLRDTLREAAEIRNEVKDAFKDLGHEAFGIGAGSGRKPIEPPVRRDLAREPESAEEESRAKRIADLKERLAEIQRTAANDQLDAESKINALIQQRAALLAQAAALGQKDEEKKIELEIKAAEIGKEIFAAQKALDASLQARTAPAIAATALRRIGGGTGGFAASGTDAQLRESRLQTTLLKQIEANTKAQKEIELKMQ